MSIFKLSVSELDMIYAYCSIFMQDIEKPENGYEGNPIKNCNEWKQWK